ncbi:MAG: ABC transporter permease [Methanobacteriaceae archaeon]|nr:ABC transporter permease [Methanobacteriaceae archaeon]
MKFLQLILKNPFRNKIRSVLAIIGIAIGIATIVALGIITEGLKESTQETLRAGGADFTIVESNVSDMFLSTIDEDYTDKVDNISGVKESVGVLTSIQPIGDNPYFVVIGIDPSKIGLSQIKIKSGRSIKEEDEIIIGKVAAEKLNKTIGDKINIKGEDYRIVGIFESGNIQEDGGSFISLKKLQKIEDKEGKVTMIYVKAEKNVNIEKIREEIEEKYGENLTTIASLEDLQSVDQGLKTVDAASWAISLLAVIIGSIGVVNTMIMSVFERTREIGVLKAVGWKNRKILTMILGESLILTLIAAVVGSLMGVAAIQILMHINMGGFIKPVYTPEIFLKAFTIAIFVGILGGFYPAYRATRLEATEALRYE